MALPVGVTTATCTVGVPVSFTGAANIRANVSVKPSVFLVHAETGTPLVDMLETIDTTDGVAGQFTLPHTDQAGFVDENQNTYTNWFYTVTIQYSNERQVMLPKTKVFQLVAGQTLVDLDKLPSGVPALPYTAPAATVTSVVGLTGPVTGAQIAADPALSATYALGGGASRTITGPTLPTLPAGTEYIWNKTDGAGTLLDILSGVA